MASRVKKYGGKKLQFLDRQLGYIFQKGKIMGAHRSICPQISPKWNIIGAKTARNQPKLCSMAKIVRLRVNGKVAQKLRSATSQFSGGTK